MTIPKNMVVIVDLSVKKTSPAGSCVLSQLVGLSEHFKIHLFTTELDGKVREYASVHRIETIKFPLLLRYMLFKMYAERKIAAFLKKNDQVALIQTTQGQYYQSDISYAHFCHKAYLKKHYERGSATGLTRIMRKLNHTYNAGQEAKAFQHCKIIVVPSNGLGKEISLAYPSFSSKVKVIPNSIDLDYFARPFDFDRKKERHQQGLDENEIIIAFVALGDFARKGLSLLLESLKLKNREESPFRLLVVGGKPREIDTYKKMAKVLGLGDKVRFMGLRSDIRPFLWMSDMFALPSSYETFSLVSIQAAAAGLPILVTPLYGVEDYIVNGHNGWLVPRDAECIRAVLNGIGNHDYDLEQMGTRAKESVRQYDEKKFHHKWIELYRSLC